MDTSGNTKMSIEQKAKAYEMALEAARKELGVDRKEWEVVQRVLHNIFPELRESEDEIIRNRLINLIRELASATVPIMTSGYFIDGQDKRYIAYLEKQKDAFENGRQLGIMQEQARQELGWPDEKKKEHQNNSDAPEKALGRDLISPKDKDKNLDEIAQDYVDGVKEYNPEPTWDLMQTAVCYGYHYCEQKEQKPDDDPLDDPKFLKGFDTGREVQRIFDEQKPAEWSEEDTEMYINVASSLRGYACGLENEEHKRHIKKGLDWLENRFQSLRPVSEWNREDRNRHTYLCDLLRETWDKVDKGSCIDDAISWLEELPTRVSLSSWKPSEEQMRELKTSYSYWHSITAEVPNTKLLESLYNDLKGLM